jgi:hypothetical protein
MPATRAIPRTTSAIAAGVKTQIQITIAGCTPQVLHCTKVSAPMSQLGQTQHIHDVRIESAIHPIATESFIATSVEEGPRAYIPLF